MTLLRTVSSDTPSAGPAATRRPPREPLLAEHRLLTRYRLSRPQARVFRVRPILLNTSEVDEQILAVLYSCTLARHLDACLYAHPTRATPVSTPAGEAELFETTSEGPSETSPGIPQPPATRSGVMFP
jgi:hypothetical protein